MLNAAIDSLVSKVQNGVVIQFEKIGPDPPPLQTDVVKLENGLNVDMKGRILGVAFVTMSRQIIY